MAICGAAEIFDRVQTPIDFIPRHCSAGKPGMLLHKDEFLRASPVKISCQGSAYAQRHEGQNVVWTIWTLLLDDCVPSTSELHIQPPLLLLLLPLLRLCGRIQAHPYRHKRKLHVWPARLLATNVMQLSNPASP